MKIFNTKLYILEEMTQEDLNNLALERNTLAKENARLKDKENKIIKKLESYNLDYLHETNEHNLADTIEYLLELLKEN